VVYFLFISQARLKDTEYFIDQLSGYNERRFDTDHLGLVERVRDKHAAMEK
jgi:hypothetical protein